MRLSVGGVVMKQMKKIHLDELPERCRRDIERFFHDPNAGSESAPPVFPDFSRNPQDYVILAAKEKKGSNYSKWQTSFLKKSDMPHFKKYHPNYRSKYFVVWEENLFDVVWS